MPFGGQNPEGYQSVRPAAGVCGVRAAITRADRLAVAGVLFLLAAAPPFVWWWEASLARHLLGQFPLLVLAGVTLGLPGHGRAVPRDHLAGLAAVLLAVFTLAFWMLPRWLDAAVGDARVDALKIATLVLLTGMPLAWGWARLGIVARGVIQANAISMFLILGVLYRTFPDRLCNNYLASEQPAVGAGMFVIAGLLALAGALPALLGTGRPPAPGP